MKRNGLLSFVCFGEWVFFSLFTCKTIFNLLLIQSYRGTFTGQSTSHVAPYVPSADVLMPFAIYLQLICLKNLIRAETFKFIWEFFPSLVVCITIFFFYFFVPYLGFALFSHGDGRQLVLCCVKLLWNDPNSHLVWESILTDPIIGGQLSPPPLMCLSLRDCGPGCFSMWSISVIESSTTPSAACGRWDATGSF